jgi:hypothetical protein
VPSRDLLSVPFDELSEADFDRMIARAQRAEWLRRWTTREISIKRYHDGKSSVEILSGEAARDWGAG